LDIGGRRNEWRASDLTSTLTQELGKRSKSGLIPFIAPWHPLEGAEKLTSWLI